MKLLMAIFLALGLAVAPPARALAPLPPPERLTIQSDGHPMRVWARMAQKPRGSVLFVHGRTWSALPNFDLHSVQTGSQLSILKAFAAQGFNAYAVDLRGYGETPRDAIGYLTPKRAAADVDAVLGWIAKRDGRKAMLVGYSRGSQVAFLTAQTYPDAMSVLVLYGGPGDPARYANASPPQVRKAPTTHADAISDFITPTAASPAVVEAYAQAALKSDPVKMDWGQEDQFNPADPAQIKVPTLFIHGVADPNANAAFLSRLFVGLGNPAKAWVVLPNADHAAHVEKGQAQWVAAIIDFWNLNRPTP
ncbi:MAG TPA: alpha/beta fold hydrolase [Caulobacteraceae bacterium]|nr:alpha/beta fold hydrolase [Caulobacteraceae bacterium]